MLSEKSGDTESFLSVLDLLMDIPTFGKGVNPLTVDISVPESQSRKNPFLLDSLVFLLTGVTPLLAKSSVIGDGISESLLSLRLFVVTCFVPFC
jgi:hypothetical protein